MLQIKHLINQDYCDQHKYNNLIDANVSLLMNSGLCASEYLCIVVTTVYKKIGFI